MKNRNKQTTIIQQKKQLYFFYKQISYQTQYQWCVYHIPAIAEGESETWIDISVNHGCHRVLFRRTPKGKEITIDNNSVNSERLPLANTAHNSQSIVKSLL